ncbi:MAG: SlyX family protein [Alsobacter sp.]
MTRELEVAEKDFSARLEDVEVRLAYQDQVIEDLNKVIVEQWSAMDTFRRQIERLEERVRDLQERPIPGAQDEPPPPHY